MKKILLLVCLTIIGLTVYGQKVSRGTINRKEVVQRHNLHLTDPAEAGPTQVGNGNFAYGFDITGMQTFNDQFTTMSHWSWHSTPAPPGLSAADFKQTEIDTYGRMVPYDVPDPKQPALSQWLASNPHRFNLGRIGLWLKNEDGSKAVLKDIQQPLQYFDLWSAVAVSTFELGGKPVKVTTVADPHKDMVAFKIESPLIEMGRLGVFIDFPYANLNVFSNSSDYNKPQLHQTVLRADGNNGATFDRVLDKTVYGVKVRWSNHTTIEREAPHRYRFSPQGGKEIEYVFSFAPVGKKLATTSFTKIRSGSATYWPGFWKTGGFVDLSGSKDKRWRELERRVVLSQYVMRINASGKYPAQETGLVNNSWSGRFHYEMILWHSAHNALWDRWPLLNNSISVYKDNLMAAKRRAAEQGYSGARFPKCTGPDGREWPHPIHAFLIWQQPHPIFFANLDYRAHPVKSTLKKWSAVIEATADFLASYAHFDSSRNEYVLGGPISFMPENNDYYTDQNPAFELGYWRYALRTAQQLRKAEGQPIKRLWDSVYQQLSPIPVSEGTYLQWEGVEGMWTKFNFEHPALLGIYGLLPGDGVDTAIMKKTFGRVEATWNFDSVWGWDFPMAAMTAARIGAPDKAINMLLNASPKNSFDSHGLVGGGNPYPYIPTNGALLYAIAFMTAGWDGDGGKPEPGFPAGGSWIVRWEDLKKAP